MNTVNFGNNGVIELASITTMGISVKDSDSPIGFFGTGLKYALAVLLREKAEITIKSPDFTAKVFGAEINVRGKEFTTVNLEVTKGEETSVVDMGITTHLGANWGFSDAFRELYSNTLDEGGEVWKSSECDKTFDTVISVKSDGIADTYDSREEIFPNLRNKTLLYQNGVVQVYKWFSDNLYYKGVKVHETDGSYFTYNFLAGQSLTEDRTLSSLWLAKYAVSNILAANLGYNEAVAMFSSGKPFESECDMSDKPTVSPGFLDAVKYALKHLDLDYAYEGLLRLHLDFEALYKDVTDELTRLEQSMLKAAKEFLKDSLCRNLDDYPIKVMDSLGKEIIGKASNGSIYLARDYLTLGMNHIASTIYEEYVHLFKGLRDNCYEMQTFLFDTIIHQELERQSLIEELK